MNIVMITIEMVMMRKCCRTTAQFFECSSTCWEGIIARCKSSFFLRMLLRARPFGRRLLERLGSSFTFSFFKTMPGGARDSTFKVVALWLEHLSMSSHQTVQNPPACEAMTDPLNLVFLLDFFFGPTKPLTRQPISMRIASMVLGWKVKWES